MESSNLNKSEYTKMYWVSKKRLEKILIPKKLPAGLIAATFITYINLANITCKLIQIC